MSTLAIELPESVLLASGQTREEFLTEAKFLLLAKLYELGRVSSGKAAELCGMHLAEFLFATGRMGIPAVELDDTELEEEFSDA